MKKLIVKLASVGVLAASLAVLNSMPAHAQYSCQTLCGIQNGQCHSGCSTNWPCHNSCEVQYRACLARC